MKSKEGKAKPRESIVCINQYVYEMRTLRSASRVKFFHSIHIHLFFLFFFSNLKKQLKPKGEMTCKPPVGKKLTRVSKITLK